MDRSNVCPTYSRSSGKVSCGQTLISIRTAERVSQLASSDQGISGALKQEIETSLSRRAEAMIHKNSKTAVCASVTLLLLCQSGAAQIAGGPLPLVGVNFAGAAFAAERIPGRLGWDYSYPNIGSIGYFAAKGANVIRLCVLLERLQPQLGSD